MTSYVNSFPMSNYRWIYKFIKIHYRSYYVIGVIWYLLTDEKLPNLNLHCYHSSSFPLLVIRPILFHQNIQCFRWASRTKWLVGLLRFICSKLFPELGFLCAWRLTICFLYACYDVFCVKIKFWKIPCRALYQNNLFCKV